VLEVLAGQASVKPYRELSPEMNAALRASVASMRALASALAKQAHDTDAALAKEG
jgi:hypothetical protein